MTERPQIFADEWRRCLAAHFQATVRLQDDPQTDTITRLLSQLNFPAQELAALQATAGSVPLTIPEQSAPKNRKEDAPNPESLGVHSLGEKQPIMDEAEGKREDEPAVEEVEDVPSLDLMEQDHEPAASENDEPPAADPQLKLFETALS
ncbi:MAG: hypothetical protein OXF83_01785 [Anaerolineaceae bacterium]|nr:hypothetical protein [Anaerolineaceae bacterium]MCY3935373.1 hypothetical protein [Chloroflexota bacterium]